MGGPLEARAERKKKKRGQEELQALKWNEIKGIS